MPAPYEPPLNEAKLKARDASIPAEWRLDAAAADNLVDVRSVPRSCGILSAREIELTEARGRIRTASDESDAGG